MPEKLYPRTLTKPSIAIAGAGNLARALAPALKKAGYKIDQVLARSRPSSFRNAKSLAAKVGAKACVAANAKISAEIVWFCVPDSSIAAAAASLCEATEWRGKVALHSSGALTSDQLSLLRRAGASVASLHPLMTFVRGSQPALAGVSFAVEGDRKAVKLSREIISSLGGRFFSIKASKKAAYHAWGMFISPLLTAHLAAAEKVAAAAGVPKKDVKMRALPILHQTLANYSKLSAAESFSGPIARGDVPTIKKHLLVLRATPVLRNIYLALARSSLSTLPVKNRRAVEKILGAR